MQPTSAVSITFFSGAEQDCIPEGPPLAMSWEELFDFFEGAAAEARGKPKGGAGYMTGCTFRSGDVALLTELDAGRASRGVRPLDALSRQAILQNGYRCKELVDEVHAIVVDYDDRPTVPPVWTGWPAGGLAYQSHNWHPVTAPGKWRVVLQLASPVPAARYDHLKAALSAPGVLPEGAIVRWAGQPAFLPTCPLGNTVGVMRLDGPALNWEAMCARVPAPLPRVPRADDVLAAPRQDTTNDARIAEALSNIWGATTGHRAFGALGGIMYRMGISNERAVSIVEDINSRVDHPHADPAGRVDEAYDDAHEMGKPKLLEALRAAAPAGVPDHAVGTVWNMVEVWLEDSVRAPVLAEIVPRGDAYLAAAINSDTSLATQENEERLATLNAHLKRNAKGEVKNLVFNTLLTLGMHFECRELFAWDDFTQQTVFLRAPEMAELRGVQAGEVFDEDRHTGLLQSWFGKRDIHEPSPTAMITAVHTDAQRRPFHAVRAYLDGLRGKWDGVDRNLVEYLGAEITQYHLAVCEKWMISAVARAMVPGAKADAMLILEGRQGHRKSTAIRCLCPDVRWFFEVASRAVGNKDFMQDMRGKWLCEVPEVDQLTLSRDESELKALLTRQSDNYRPSYARKSRDFLRQLVFAATTNKTEYLRDETGNRRYWPVACGVVGAIREAALCTDRDQLWAQAVALYDKGMATRAAGADTCVWWLDPEETELAVEEQRARLEEDPWTQAVTDWLEGHPDAVREGFRSTDVLAGLPGAKPAADLEQRDLQRVGKTLRLLGFESRREMAEGVRERRWFRGVK